MVKLTDLRLLHTTAKGEKVLVKKGELGPWDFRVYYWKQGLTVPRSPKHSHLTIDLYIKYFQNKELTMEMVTWFRELLDKVSPIDYFPPKFQFFKQEMAAKYDSLDSYGIFSSEMLLAYEELMVIQEKTNYGPMEFHRRLLNDFGERDIYSVINTATYNAGG